MTAYRDIRKAALMHDGDRYVADAVANGVDDFVRAESRGYARNGIDTRIQRLEQYDALVQFVRERCSSTTTADAAEAIIYWVMEPQLPPQAKKEGMGSRPRQVVTIDEYSHWSDVMVRLRW